MKFVCEQCQTKYSIEDARVKGKVLKIRCKTCQALITVRDPALDEAEASHHEDAHAHPEPHGDGEHTQVGSAPAAMMQAMARPAAVAARVLWYVSFDGEQEGPHPVEKARDRIRDEVAFGKEAFCWRDGFADWLPVDKVPDLAVALRPAPTAQPVIAAAPNAVKPAPAAAVKPVAATSPAAAKPTASATVATPAKPAAGTAAIPAATAAKPAAATAVAPAKPVAATAVAPAKAAIPVAASPSVSAKPAVAAATTAATPRSAPVVAEGPKPAVTSAAKPALPATPTVAAKPALPATPTVAAKPALPATPTVAAKPSPAAVEAVKSPVSAASLTAAKLVSAPAPDVAALGPSDSTSAAGAAPKAAEKQAAPSAKPAESVKVEPKLAAVPSKVEIAAEVKLEAPKADVKPAPVAEQKPVPLAAKPVEKKPEKNGNKASKESVTSGGVALAEAAAQAEPLPLPAVPVRKNGVAHTNGASHAVAAVAVMPPAADPTMIVVNPPREQKSVLLYALVGCVALILLLGSALGYTMMHHGRDTDRSITEATVAGKEATPTAVAPAVDDRPVGIAEPAPVKVVPPAPAVAGNPIVTPAAGHHPGHAAHRGATPAPPPALSSEQKALASLYGGSQDHADVGRVPVALHNDHPREQVSDSQIAGVVTRNKKSLQLCYERVLKHDNSLRNLRTDVTLKIGISGRVTGVSFSDGGISSGDLGKCLSQTIRRWPFPPQDAEYQTAFPIILQAQ